MFHHDLIQNPVAGRRPPRANRRLAVVGLIGALMLGACSSGNGNAGATTGSGDDTTTVADVSTTTVQVSTTTTTAVPTTTTQAPTTTSAPPTTVAPPPLRTPTPEAPIRTLIMGDSTAFAIGNSMLRTNGDGLLAPEVLYKTSSGLTRPDFFDWPYYLGIVADTDPREMIILSFGANDNQDLTSPDGTINLIHEPGWREEYIRRADELTARLTAAGMRVYWVGQPLARNAGYSAAMALINEAYAEVAANNENAVFIDIWSVLAGPNGEYTETVAGPDGEPLVIRQDDGIHLTSAGGDLAATLIWERIRADWGA